MMPRTRFLASVSDLAEARLVARCGADVIDLKNPAAGALGAVAAADIRAIVAALDSPALISATIGDRPLIATEISAAIDTTAAAGVDIVKIGWFGPSLDDAVLDSLAAASARGIRLVVVLFAEYGCQINHLPALAQSGIHGVMLDTMTKRNGSLRQKLSDASLAEFVSAAQAHGLFCGLAGSLSRADIAPLRRLQPDYLGFRGALCCSGRRVAALDEAAVESVRLLMNNDIHAQMTV